MKRRAFLVLVTAPAWLALLPHARAAGPLLFHDHGHGLAFSPDGKALLAPTHTGLAAYEDHAWWQVSGPAQGFSGFSVAERAIYSSGHSPASDGGTPAGLMRSLDGGRTWQALVLAGEADFHLLAAGYRSGAIYVLNARPNAAMAAAGLFATRDEGKTWNRAAARGLVGQIHALAAHPKDPAIVAAGTDSGLYLSHDGGARFLRIERGAVTALLFDIAGERLLYAKPLSDELFARALQAGTERHALRLPQLPGDYVTCLAQSPVDGRILAFATRRRDVYLTRDGGRRWQRIARGGEAQAPDAEDTDSPPHPGEPR